MAWQSRLTQCTYKGVVLNLSSDIEIQSGKKGSVFDFPNIDGGSAQDLGNQQRKISVSAFVSGDEYDAERNVVEATLRSEGAGDLVHPTMGIFRVLPVSWRISESPEKKGGLCNFSISFVEVLTPLTPQIVSSSSNYISNSISGLISDQALRLDQIDTLDVIHPIALAKESVQKIKDSLGSTASLLSSTYTQVSAVLDATISSLILTDLETIVYSLQALMRIPSETESKLLTVFTSYDNLFNSLKNSVDIFSDDSTHLYQATLTETVENVAITQLSSMIASSKFETRESIITMADRYKTMAFDVFEAQLQREADERNQERTQPYKISSDLLIDVINLVKLTVLTLQDKAASLSPTRAETIKKDMTIIRFCFERGLDHEQFIELNPALINLEILTVGQEVYYV